MYLLYLFLMVRYFNFLTFNEKIQMSFITYAEVKKNFN